MRVLLKAAVAGLAMCAATVGVAHAQSADCSQVTTTTSIGPNGETITRREACGGVEITTTGGHAPTAPPPTASSIRSNSSNTTTTTSGDSRTRTQTETQTTTTTSPGRTETRTRTTSSSVTTPSAPSMPPVRARGTNWSVEIGGSGSVHDDDDFDALSPPPDFARIVLFDRANFRGRSIGVTQDTPNLTQRRFAGMASAARVQAGVWELCSKPNYTGTCVTTDTNLDLAAAGLNDSVASFRRVRR